MESKAASAPNPHLPILILDDEDSYRSAIVRALRLGGIDNVISSGDPGASRALVAAGKASLVLLDLQMPAASGEELLAEFSSLAPQVPVIIITGDSETATIVRCMKAGALDYLVKPIEESRLLVAVRNGLAIVELTRELSAFRDKLSGGLARPELFERIATRDERMIALFKYIEAVAPSRQSVLIKGETGTGKELFARAIHDASGRGGAFVAVNVGGLDDPVFTDTLFGHRKGAYTGAEGARHGLVAEAKGGTLFLDEIGDLDARSQIKLLRLLQEGEYYPLGSDLCLRSETRIVAATTRDVKNTPGFRSDLFYRLQTHLVEIPPLRERRDDIDLLIDRFLTRSAKSLGEPKAPELPRECRRALEAYDFPGNVRELESLVHDAVAGARGGAIDEAALLARLPPRPEGGAPPGGDEDGLLRVVGEGFPTLREAELELVRMAMRRTLGDLGLASAMLGVSRQRAAKWLSETGPEADPQAADRPPPQPLEGK
jgi:DNA-binding NtrC family response regulator